MPPLSEQKIGHDLIMLLKHNQKHKIQVFLEDIEDALTIEKCKEENEKLYSSEEFNQMFQAWVSG